MAAFEQFYFETSAPTVRPARRDQEQRVVATMARAFAGDPVARWMYPDRQQYLHYFPAFVRAFAGEAFACSTAFVSDNQAGAALWLAPGITPDDEALEALLEESVADRERSDAFALFEKMAEVHPDEPHWYLPLIGVKPAEHGNGHGSALLKHTLRRCDHAALPAYLEATTARSVPLYQRHGFEVIGEIKVGRCPPLFPMLRPRQR
jgi:ribosomal protein S18 acetylase RimI-like enzyme